MVLKTRGPLHVELVWIFYHGLSWCDISASSQTSVHFQQLVQLLPLDAAEGQSLLGWTQASTSASAALHRSFFHGFISPRANVPMTVPVKVWRFVHSTRSQLGTLSRTCAGQTSSSDWSTIYVCVCVYWCIFDVSTPERRAAKFNVWPGSRRYLKIPAAPVYQLQSLEGSVWSTGILLPKPKQN